MQSEAYESDLCRLIETSRAFFCKSAGEDVNSSVMDVDCSIKDNDGWICLKAILRAKCKVDIGQAVCLSLSLDSLKKVLGGSSLRMLINAGNTSGARCRHVELDSHSAEDISSTWWTLLYGGASNVRYLLAGFLPPVQHQTFLRVNGKNFEIGCRLERPLNAGETLDCGVLVLKTGSEACMLMEAFGDFCAKSVPPRKVKHWPVAWNSWDYYWSTFTQNDLDETLKTIKRVNPALPKPLDTVVIDMCWATDFGDWYANGRFPSGMAAAACKIRQAGFHPGIWVAPYIVHWSSKTYLRNPQVCATDEFGVVRSEHWGLSPAGRLDPTHPSGEQYLHDLFSKLAADGYEYFKLDFLHYLATLPARRCFHDESIGRMGIIRRGLEIIRRAVGPDAHILACGCPMEAAVGLADSIRVGPDISTYFSSTVLAAEYLAARYWLNRRLYLADPDFLIVRGHATAVDLNPGHNPYHEPPHSGTKLVSRCGEPWANEGEPRIWATLVGLYGGVICLGDDLAKLNDIGMDMIRKAMELPSDGTFRPLGLMDEPVPSRWMRQTEDATLLGLINWGDEPREFDVTEICLPAVELWTGSPIDGCTITVPPHDARIIIGKSAVAGRMKNEQSNG